MRRLRTSLPFVCALSILPLLASRPAFAQDPAAAEALFKKGVADMEAGDLAAACPAIEESHRLDPRPGTLFTLAECETRRGKIATAVAHYEDYLRAFAQLSGAQRTKHQARSEVAKKRIEELTPQIPHLSIMLPTDAPANVRVSRNGIDFSKTSLGIELPVDPGEHVIVIQVPGGPPAEQKVTLATGEKKALTLDVRAPAPEKPASPSNAEPAAQAALLNIESTAAASLPASGAGAPAPTSGQRIGAFVAGGIGLASLGLGVATGIVNLGNKSTIDKSCTDAGCNAEGRAALDRAKTMGPVSTIGFVVGAAGVVTSAVLFLAAPSAKKNGTTGKLVTADVGAGPNGVLVQVKGVF